MHDLMALMEATPQSVEARIASALEQMAVETRANNGVLPDPSDYRVVVECQDCDHVQYPYAINPEFEPGPEGPELVSYYVGSSGDFCDRCDSSNVELTGWGLAKDLEPSE